VKGVGVEDTLKAVTKLVFKALSVKYGDGAQAPAAPGRAPGPPRSVPAPPPKPPAAAPPTPSHDDLLSELELGTPAPLEESFDVDGNTPVGSPSPAALRAAMTPLPPPVGTPGPPSPPRPQPASAPPLPAPPKAATPSLSATRAPVAPPKAQTTLVGKNDETAALRRAIGAPGMPSEEIEMDLEEIQELDHPTHGKVVSSRSIETVAPEPVLHPDAAALSEPLELHTDAAVLHHSSETTEVEVPIDIEVAPGTTRVSLNVRLVLNLRKR